MWNKSSESKPSAQGSDAAAPVKLDVKPDVKPDMKPEIKPESKSEVIAQPSGTVAAKASVSPALAIAAPPRNSAAAQSVPTTIGTGLKIKGDLSGNSDLYIDGEAQGKIVLSDSKVTIGANGRVNADIDAREIFVEGTVQGNLKASEGVHLSASSVVKGTVLTPRITIKDGAHLSARVEMVRPNESRVSESRANSTSSSSSPSSSAAGPIVIAGSGTGETLVARAEGA